MSLKNKDQTYLIVLFHDINPTTADTLDAYISKLTESVRKHGREPVYASSRQEIDSILELHKNKA